jgi:cyclopropane-fatty-acyl-phospholipid synthase
MADRAEKIIRDLLSSAGIEVNGKNPWDIKVHDRRFYQRVLRDSSLGLGESYMDGWWDSESLDGFIYKLLLARLDKKVRGNWKIILYGLRARIFNLQKITRAFEVGKKHYDLGNDLFQTMLDKRLNYSCGYWKDARSLDEAQETKLELVCRKLCLQPGMTVLDIGCGFGAFAKYAAEKYKVKVLGVTVSKQQVELGTQLCKGLPVELRLQDYREVTGKYDRVISIGMFEHVGYRNYRNYMETADRRLKDDGVAFIHTIGGNISTTQVEPWINNYIFPSGMFPSISQIGRAMEGLFIMEDWHNFGEDYDKTLMAWYSNFNKAWPALKDKYDERFYRMWKYFLLSCAGGFRSRSMQLWQLVMTKQGRKQPDCRIV